MHRIRLQLLVNHLILVVLMGFVLSAAITSLFSLSRSIEGVINRNFSSMVISQNMRRAIHIEERAVTLFALGQQEQALNRHETARQTFDEAYNSAQEELAGNELAQYESIKTQYDAVANKVEDFLTTTPDEELDMGLTQFQTDIGPVLTQLDFDLDNIWQMNQEAIFNANHEVEQQAEWAFWESMFFTVCATILAILLALRMVKLTLNPLTILARRAEKLGMGELESRLNLQRDDEVGELAESFDLMAERLQEARKTDARRLQRAQRMSDAALENLYDPVLVSDAQGRIVYLNRAAQDIFGSVPSDSRILISEHISDQRVANAIQNAIQENTVSASEDETTFIPIISGSKRRTFRMRVTPMKDSDATLGAVAVLEDITHLRELDRLKTEFIGVASHELRTPVTSLILSNELMEEGAVGELTEKQQEVIKAQREDLERLQSLMQELLDVTRLEVGTAEPKISKVAVKPILDAVMKTKRAHAKSKGVKLRLEMDSTIPPMLADKSQITRVLTNLVQNAIRHTNTGGTVTVQATCSQNDVTFRVEDTGEGIPKEYLDKIFERFVQVPGATQGGAGLGLSIAQKIVKAHGSEMKVESEVGKGSTFSFSLKLAKKPTNGENQD